jgi:hypothetical protein
MIISQYLVLTASLAGPFDWLRQKDAGSDTRIDYYLSHDLMMETFTKAKYTNFIIPRRRAAVTMHYAIRRHRCSSSSCNELYRDHRKSLMNQIMAEERKTRSGGGEGWTSWSMMTMMMMGTPRLFQTARR